MRRFDEPRNAEFLNAINKGYVPREIAGNAANVVVNLVDKKDEDYVPPKKVFKPFSTAGRTLGSSKDPQPKVEQPKKSEPPKPSSVPGYKVSL